jgi:hypothetical protein
MSKLTRLFDYQLFEGNVKLQQVIHSVHERYRAKELSLDDLEMIAAAGTAGSADNPGRKDPQ